LAEKRYVGLGKETTFGTAASATRYIESVESIVPDQGWIIPTPVAQRAYRKKNLGKYRGSGNIGEVNVEPENIGELLQAVMGNGSDNKSNPATGVYLHTFTPQDTLDGYTVRIGVEQAERILPGCLCNSLKFRFPHEDNVKAVAAILHGGAIEAKGTLGTPTLSTLQPFPVAPVTTLTIAASDKKAYVYDGEITIDNKIPDRDSLGSRFMPKIRQGERLVAGKISAYFDETTEYDRFLAGTEFALIVKWEGPVISGAYKYYLEFHLEKCVYLKDAAPHVTSISEPLVIDAPFQSFYDSTWKDITVALQNTVSATY